MNMHIANSFASQFDFAARRARLAAQLGPKGIAILPTAPEQMRNRDADFLYRHDSYFLYPESVSRLPTRPFFF